MQRADIEPGGRREGAGPPTGWASTIVPTVVKKTTHGERGYDIFSRLLEDRIIFIGSVVNDTVANLTVAQMLYLQSENKKQDIHLYIHSNGGLITSGLAIYDTMQLVQCDVATYVVGHAFSMAAVLLAGGTSGKRFALPHARVMLHQPWGDMEGTAADISIHAEEMVKLKKWINKILADHTGQPLERIEEDADREFYMSAGEAREYGLVDEVLAGTKES
ncbi:MAG: ATP-dependent Clp protease proteolytic subunit [Candidatus Brocadiaceae bacterium]